MKVYRIVAGKAVEIDMMYEPAELPPPTYTTIDFSNDHWKEKPIQNWQSEGKRRKPRVK